jgi:hypothetical protein
MIAGEQQDQDHPVAVLLRWEASGAVWRVARRSSSVLEIELVTCTGDEVAGLLRSGDPALLAFVGERSSSEEG